MTGAEATADRNTARGDTAPPARDPRLDVFRGLAMFIILVSHTPGNPWGRWIPARFGFSDATEIFVFCSGMASAIAFGATFARAGWTLGTARVLFRVWQVYWAHIGLFLVLAMGLAAIDLSGAFEKVYVDTLALGYFFADPLPMMVGLVTLTYVPNYFDILPMYLVLLAMLPFVVALARVSPWLAMGACVAVWLAANLDLLDLPADPLGDRTWFFNPFGWQLVFFTGFAFMAGWLPPPPVSRGLMWAAIAYLVLTLPLSSGHAVSLLKVTWPAAADWAMATYPEIAGLRTKSEQGILRLVHFLSLAYLAWRAVGPGGRRLRFEGPDPFSAAARAVLGWITKVGQQSLAVFIVSMVAARVMGLVLDVAGTGEGVVTLVNLAGFALLIGTAYGVAWIKSQPWRVAAPAAPVRSPI